MTLRSDDGFSLVEVIIAMFLLATIALAILPLAMAATSLSVDNRTVAAANSFASAQLAPFRAAFPSSATGSKCGDAASLAMQLGGQNPTGATLPVTVSDIQGPAGTGLQATLSVSACPTALGTVTVTVSIAKASAPSVAVTRVKTKLVVQP